MNPPVRRLLLRQFFFIFGVVYFLSGFGLYLHSALHVTVAAVGWLLAGAGILGGVVQAFVVSPLAARIGERLVAQVGFVALFLGYASLYWVHELLAFTLVVAVWAVGAALIEPTIMAALSLRIPPKERGAVMGVSDSVNSVALILAPSASGAIIGANPRAIGFLPLLATIAAFIIGAIVKDRRNRANSKRA